MILRFHDFMIFERVDVIQFYDFRVSYLVTYPYVGTWWDIVVVYFS